MARTKKLGSLKNKIEKTLSVIKSPTFNLGFSKIDLWTTFGNFALNRIMSGDFNKGFLYGRNYVLYGESGSGKSLLMAKMCGDEQKRHNSLIVWIDVEKATDDDAGKEWFTRAGIDVDEMIYATAATLEEVKSIIAKITSDYKAEVADGATMEDLQPIVFVIDSWSACMTASQYEQAVQGVMKGDQGQKAKQTGDVILATTHLCGGLPIMVMGTMHIMDNQEMYGRKHKITGGNKALYMASGALLLTKSEMKDEDVEDDEAKSHFEKLKSRMTAEEKKKKKIAGIICNAENIKSRNSKPFEKVKVQIPYVTGIDPYSGLFEVMMQEGLIWQSGQGWYAYTKDGEEVKFRKKDFVTDHADIIMNNAGEAQIEEHDVPEEFEYDENEEYEEYDENEEITAYEETDFSETEDNAS